MNIPRILNAYDPRRLRIATLGGHSALDICRGAKIHGFRTTVIAERGREKPYTTYYRAKDGRGIIDEVIVVKKFADILKKTVQERLRNDNALFIPHRYLAVYCDLSAIEKKFMVPLFGSRMALRFEERTASPNQYTVLQKSGIRMPKIFKNPRTIDRLVIVKAAEAKRSYERAFFLCANFKQYQEKSREFIEQKITTPEAVRNTVIEEYIVGAQVNFNFFYSPLNGKLELIGTDMRRQTNIDGLLRLPVPLQYEALQFITPKYIETGHIAVTVKESLLGKIFTLGEKFIRGMKKVSTPGIIGPFALQGAVVTEDNKEDIVIFDVSMRIPGSPGTMFTPYSAYTYGAPISYGERIALEIKNTAAAGRLDRICT
ncbi:DUF1297 domain-containing protein [Candidatus Wolfebacteria bacterium]|nr:DUF1297 domain-containing protein [Candidatus Wolfebacteria bacterium]